LSKLPLAQSGKTKDKVLMFLFTHHFQINGRHSSCKLMQGIFTDPKCNRFRDPTGIWDSVQNTFPACTRSSTFRQKRTTERRSGLLPSPLGFNKLDTEAKNY